MLKYIFRVVTFTVIIHFSSSHVVQAFDFDKIIKYQLPSKKTLSAIKGLDTVGRVGLNGESSKPRELIIDRPNAGTIGTMKIENSGGKLKSLPFVVPNSMIIQFKPQATKKEIDNYLKSNNLSVIEVFSSIGSVQVRADLSKYFTPKLSDKSTNDAILRGIIDASSEFRKDERILSATPDILLTDKSSGSKVPEITNILHPSDIITSDQSTKETVDWGIADIEANKLWVMSGASDGAIFGVMDVGFARHENITFLGLLIPNNPKDHGNHVAGIGCGRHNNIGTRGVLPNCFVRARSGNVFFESSGSNPQLNFMVLFSQILRTLENFVTEQDDVFTFNISLGYNWRNNFGINPDLDESAQWRSLVEMQGTFLVPLLRLANKKGKVIFSAAGNDSYDLSVPISAKYASPFNWAAIIAREKGIAENGVIVGAHDSNGKRAPFSNSNADISCPGVNILSALAYNASKKPSSSSYGKMSGTSMASPYCAAGHILLRLVRPGYTGVEAFQCMLSSKDKTDNGTPMLRLTQALAACPARS